MARAVKQLIKRTFFGPSIRPFVIRRGVFRGLRLLVDPLHQSQRLLGLWEREIAGVLRGFAARAVSAVDVGAADGWYTVYFASRANILQVFACEPDGAAVNMLYRNLELQKAPTRRKVSVIPQRVGSSDADGSVTLDLILTAAPGPIVAKIDVDGDELDCLEGFKSTMAQRDVMLIVETHSVELERECVEFCARLGYRCKIIPNGWYRIIIPELRPIAHNRWFAAWSGGGL